MPNAAGAPGATGGPLLLLRGLARVEDFAFDHQTPTCRAADYSLGNLAVCCRPCNEAKGLLTAAEFRQLLALVDGWHPRARQDLLARLKAGGKRGAGR